MRISELTRRSGVPTSTIKFYIRDGLLPAGERSQRNQASYDERHLQRLDLIKALREVAGLSLDVVRDVLAQADAPWDQADPIGRAYQVIYRAPDRERSATQQSEYEKTRAEVAELMGGLAWVLPEARDELSHFLNVDLITDAVIQIRKHIEPEFGVEQLRDYAKAAWLFSDAVFASFEDRVPQPGDDLVDPTRAAILGFLLIDPLVAALVRTALVMRSMHLSGGLPLPGPRLGEVDSSHPVA